MKFLIVIFLGRPGSGKGTQAELLAKKFGLDYIGSGDLLREKAENSDFTAKKLRIVMQKGLLVPTPVIFEMWMKKLEDFKQKPKLKGFIMDGSPRKLIEAVFLEQALEWYEWGKFAKIILIDISSRESFQRLTKRRICKKCGNLIPWIGEFKKLKRCNKCQGELITRADDKPEAIKNRLKEFRKEVIPVINFYKKQGKLIKIDGEQPIEAVHRDILKKLP